MRWNLAVCVLAVFLVPGCSGPPDPKVLIEERIDEAVELAESREADRLLEFVSDGYLDDDGRNKETVGQIVRYHLFQNRSVHLLHKVRWIEITEPGLAEVVVVIAVAGSPIEGIEQIGQIQADLLRFDVEMAEEEEGEWRLTGSTWERATATDFF